MKVRDLKAELVKAKEDAEVVVALDEIDIQNIVKEGSKPGDNRAALIVLGTENVTPIKELFTIWVQKKREK